MRRSLARSPAKFRNEKSSGNDNDTSFPHFTSPFVRSFVRHARRTNERTPPLFRVATRVSVFANHLIAPSCLSCCLPWFCLLGRERERESWSVRNREEIVSRKAAVRERDSVLQSVGHRRTKGERTTDGRTDGPRGQAMSAFHTLSCRGDSESEVVSYLHCTIIPRCDVG